MSEKNKEIECGTCSFVFTESYMVIQRFIKFYFDTFDYDKTKSYNDNEFVYWCYNIFLESKKDDIDLNTQPCYSPLDMSMSSLSSMLTPILFTEYASELHTKEGYTKLLYDYMTWAFNESNTCKDIIDFNKYIDRYNQLVKEQLNENI